jgi:hypothetical protein|tara:strand:- start:712 stop:966 length:255 start_codon:yes stop_codon:yes gene_type:complete
MIITEKEARYLEGYAAALQDIEFAVTGDNGCSKSYDPLTVANNIMHSAAYNLREVDGGRHHPCDDFKDIEEIKTELLNETHGLL